MMDCFLLLLINNSCQVTHLSVVELAVPLLHVRPHVCQDVCFFFGLLRQGHEVDLGQQLAVRLLRVSGKGPGESAVDPADVGETCRLSYDVAEWLDTVDGIEVLEEDVLNVALNVAELARVGEDLLTVLSHF